MRTGSSVQALRKPQLGTGDAVRITVDMQKGVVMFHRCVPDATVWKSTCFYMLCKVAS